jgi:hypothetical protein
MSEAGLDLAKFSRVVGLLGSAHDGEKLNAVTLGGRMLQSAGMRWEDFIESYRRAEIATEAAAVLLAENGALKAELEQLRSTSKGVALLEDVGAKVSDSRLAAEWALDLHRRGQVWLAPDFEIEFLQSCTRWTGRLTPKMQSIFQRIMDRIVTRTGLAPP